ncbi:hypothetical protein [Devosia sp.]|jgi:hypothetical protein|uniref:hypothetical protein n=1 Tax=Devosia sp. TaxID=1871048 RepID=UPI001AC98055|nr:hypothetical protein [Devosia sp.]MBN9331979.1 hypothetical protein [Devosia sp.]
MSSCSTDIDPYAELDNRADAAELSEEFRPPVAINRRRPISRTLGHPGRRRG